MNLDDYYGILGAICLTFLTAGLVALIVICITALGRELIR
jgi:hypothetical protein